MEPLPPKPPGPPSGPPPPETFPDHAPEGVVHHPGALPPEQPAPDGAAPAPGTAAREAAGAERPADEPPARRRPRRRTPLLVAGATLLGVVAGVATGYTIQADREPTPLPPLSGPPLSYPEKRLSEEDHEPIPAKHDRRVKTDGDLRKLLVGKPDGARESLFYPDEPSLVPVRSYAGTFLDPGGTLEYLVDLDVRRVAGISWDSGGDRTTVVSLVQFRDTSTRGARHHAEGQLDFIARDPAADTAQPLPGSGNGSYYFTESPVGEPGFVPLYEARAVAYRGDIMMDVYVLDAAPIDVNDIRELAVRQLERL